MLSINETFVSLNNRLLSLEDKQMSCFVNMNLWFRTHLFATLFLELIFLHIYMILMFICMFFFLSFPYLYSLLNTMVQNNSLQAHAEEERYLYAIRLLKKEIILIFFYILFAFIYRWLILMDSIITSMTFYRWLIEASFIPIVVGSSFFGDYIRSVENFFDIYETMYIFGLMPKMPLFFCMRYAESKIDCFVNNLKASAFYILCKWY